MRIALAGGVRALQRLWAFVLLGCVWSFGAYADHLFQSDIFPDFGAEEWAKMSMEYADLIAVGEFVSVCDAEFNKPLLRNFRLVTAKFKVKELFKGRHDVGDTVDVAVVADMLVYPGERVTRHQKRSEIRRKLNDRRDTVMKLLEAIGAAQHAPRQDITNNGKRDLQDELADINRRLLSVPPSILAVLDQPSFYEVGGMIEPDVQYVVALWLEDDGSYLLTESYDRDIFWGEEAEQMADAFRLLTGR